jgi:hypothetical protein
MMFKKIICVDFDGVIHGYRKGWQNGEIYDKPVPGAIDWLITMVCTTGIEIAIYSSRSKDPKLLAAMENWLRNEFVLEIGREGLTTKQHAIEMFEQLTFPTQKPAAWLTIDDRAICFSGVFPSKSQIESFKPWNRE